MTQTDRIADALTDLFGELRRYARTADVRRSEVLDMVRREVEAECDRLAAEMRDAPAFEVIGEWQLGQPLEPRG